MMGKKYKIIFLLILLIVIISITSNKSYSRYYSTLGVNITGETGNMKCNAEIINTGIDGDGDAYFDVAVTNYINNDITETDIKYNIQVSTDENSSTNGYYKWIDSSLNSNDSFEENVSTNDYYFGKTEKESQTIRFKVNVEGKNAADVTYKAVVNCYQTNANHDEPLINEKGSNYLISLANRKNITNYEDGDTTQMYEFTHTKTGQTNSLREYRYIGNNPSNYVNFNCDNDGTNCETWRIVGVFDVDDGNGNINQRIKLVRGSSFNNLMVFDTSNSNVWNNASLNTFLNGDYFNRTGDAADYGLKESARNMIGNAKYYLGLITHDDNLLAYGSTEELYYDERQNETVNNNQISWTGKIGLMHPSDHYYDLSKGIYNDCYNNPTNCISNTVKNSGWIYASDSRYGSSGETTVWLLANYFQENSVLQANSDSKMYSITANSSLSVRPVVYLLNDIIIKSGSGTSDDPYTLDVSAN